MQGRDRVRSWVQSGKQVGIRLYLDVLGRRMYVAVGIQRHLEKIKVAVFEIEEQFMAGEEYEREEVVEFDEVDAAAAYVDTKTHARFDALTPMRGNRVFDPETVPSDTSDAS